jgi:hypothetical protein
VLAPIAHRHVVLTIPPTTTTTIAAPSGRITRPSWVDVDGHRLPARLKNRTADHNTEPVQERS